jgi:hypothetical protein
VPELETSADEQVDRGPLLGEAQRDGTGRCVTTRLPIRRSVVVSAAGTYGAKVEADAEVVRQQQGRPSLGASSRRS